MKKFTLSVVAVLAMSAFAVAGGDIEPVVEPVVVAEPIMTDSGFYVGVAYSYMGMETVDNEGDTWMDEGINTGMLQAGYKFNPYVAVEARYWFGGDEDAPYYDTGLSINADLDSWGIYVKPMYPVTDAFDIYALLGYASSSYTVTGNPGGGSILFNSDDTRDGFSWGLGVSYDFNNNVSIFLDYVSLYNDTGAYDVGNLVVDDTLDSWNFGVTYKF